MFKNSFLANILRKDNFISNALLVALIIIVSMIIFGAVISISQGSPFLSIEACVENTFLALCLFIIVIGLKKGNYEIFHKLFGELLAIYFVTNASLFVENLVELIENENREVLDYIYLVFKFFIMASSIAVFLDHLFESSEEVEMKSKIIIYIMLIVIFAMMIFNLITMIILNNKEIIINLAYEFFFILFGTTLALIVMSLEIRRIENIE